MPARSLEDEPGGQCRAAWEGVFKRDPIPSPVSCSAGSLTRGFHVDARYSHIGVEIEIVASIYDHSGMPDEARTLYGAH